MLSSLLKARGRIFYGWVVVIDLLIILAIVMGTRYSFGVFFKSIESEFNLSRAVTSSVFAVYNVVCSVFAILGGWTQDRYGPRTIVLLMGLFMGLSLILTSRTDSAWQLFITYSLLLAIGTGAGFTVVITTVSTWFVEKRGLALGIASSGDGLGTLAMAPIAMYLISGFGWRTSYIVMGVIGGLVLSSSSLLLRRSPGELGTLPDGAAVGAFRKSDSTQPPSLTLSQALRTRNYWVLGMIWLLFAVCFSLVLTHIVPHLTDIGVSAASAAIVLALIGGISVIGRLTTGLVSDRIGRKMSAIICALLLAVTMMWIAWSQYLWMFYLFAVAFGFAYGGFSTLVAALIGDTFGVRSLGAITGTLVFGFNLGAAVGPLIGGLIFDARNDYLLAFLAAAAAMLVAALLVALVEREA